MEQIRLLIADDEEVFREGLVRLLKDQPHIKIVHQCGSGQDVLRKSQETKPDIILLDSQITGCDVLEAVEEINKCSPEVKVVMITRPEASPNPLHILKAGARGCLAKSTSVDDLVKSIELISSGRIIISPLMVSQLVDEEGV